MTLFSQTTGRGPSVVLLHGWGMNSDVWEDVMKNLALSYQVTAVDLPGHGRSTDVVDNFSLSEVARQVAEIMPPDSILVGWSLGGLVAIQITLDLPGLINKLVLVASSPQFIKDDDWPDGMDPEVLGSFAGDLKADYRATIKRFIAIQAIGSENSREEQRVLRDRVFRHGHPQLSALKGGLDILHNSNLRPRLAEINRPTYLLTGQNDTLVRKRAVDNTQQLLKNSKLGVIKGAGHAPFLSHKTEFLQELRAFLDE